jgi:hypothetical protein
LSLFGIKWRGLKIQWTLVRAGSSPASSTNEEKTKAFALVFLFLAFLPNLFEQKGKKQNS